MSNAVEHETEVEAPIVWQVTLREGEGINLHFGQTMAELPISDDQKIVELGKILINLGTRLMTSSVSEEGGDDYEDWEDDD